jgi:hypothetical protein
MLRSPRARELTDWELRWSRLQTALGYVQEELRPDQRAKIAALIDLAFTLGREAEREMAKELPQDR